MGKELDELSAETPSKLKSCVVSDMKHHPTVTAAKDMMSLVTEIGVISQTGIVKYINNG